MEYEKFPRKFEGAFNWKSVDAHSVLWPDMKVSFSIVSHSQFIQEALSERTAVMPPFNMTFSAT